MAYFAKIGTDNIVEQVISINNSVLLDENNIEQEQLGVDFINSLYGTNDVWKQTSYNTYNGVHNFDGTPLRKNFASIGDVYDVDRDAFIPQKPPFPSWVLNEFTCNWEPPVPKPTEGMWTWDEEGQKWNQFIAVVELEGNAEVLSGNAD